MIYENVRRTMWNERERLLTAAQSDDEQAERYRGYVADHERDAQQKRESAEALKIAAETLGAIDAANATGGNQ